MEHHENVVFGRCLQESTIAWPVYITGILPDARLHACGAEIVRLLVIARTRILRRRIIGAAVAGVRRSLLSGGAYGIAFPMSLAR